MYVRGRQIVADLLVPSTLRFAITGAVVALINFTGPVILNAATSLSIEACIPIVFAFALSVHFTAQRVFVWRHATGFELETHEQVGRYLVGAGVQYGATAGLTAVLPGLLGWPQRVVYVIVAVAVTITFFVVLRSFIFHAADDPAPEATAATAPAAQAASDPESGSGSSNPWRDSRMNFGR